MTIAPLPTSLEYATPKATPTPRWLASAALACGITPAIVGVAIALAYSLFELQIFRMIGFAWLLFGGLIVLAGFGFVLTHFCWPRDTVMKRKNGRAIIALIVLLLNLPIALGCMVVGVSSSDRVTVIVYNDGPNRIDNVLIAHGTRSVSIGPIAPGGSASGILIPNYGDVTAIVRRNGSDGSIQIVGHGDAGEIGSPMPAHIDSAGKVNLLMQ